MKQFMIVLVLMWAVTVGCTPAEPLTDAPTDSAATQPAEESVAATPIREERTPMSQESLSAEIQQAVLKEVGQQQNVSPDQLQITKSEAADWPDACLGLAGPDEMCAQMITPGWALSVTDGQQTWQYRSDLDALQVKQDK